MMRKNKRRILWFTNIQCMVIFAYILYFGIDNDTARLIIQWAAVMAMAATGMYTSATIYENVKTFIKK